MMGPEEEVLWAEVQRTEKEHQEAVSRWHAVHTKAVQQELEERIEKLVQERIKEQSGREGVEVERLNRELQERMVRHGA